MTKKKKNTSGRLHTDPSSKILRYSYGMGAVQRAVGDEYAVLPWQGIRTTALGDIAPALEGQPDLKRSELIRLIKWHESLTERKRSDTPKHEMLKYYERALDEYDVDEVADGLRHFLQLFLNAQANQGGDDQT